MTNHMLARTHNNVYFNPAGTPYLTRNCRRILIVRRQNGKRAITVSSNTFTRSTSLFAASLF